MEKDSEVIPHQDAIHVFPNANGGITIHQMSSEDDGLDDLVSFGCDDVEAIVRAIRSVKKELKARP